MFSLFYIPTNLKFLIARMSLSFVASAVQTVTADGGFEETKIESTQIDAINQRNANKPLFEQLRQNQEEEQAKQEEMQREMMRGTRALDDEDVAHLDALEKHRQERERIIQQRTQEELMLFRAARAERQQGNVEGDDENESQGSHESSNDPGITRVAPLEDVGPTKPLGPKLIVKKRKRRVDSENEVSEKQKDAPGKPQNGDDDEKCTTIESKKQQNPSPPIAFLGGLLSGYGSSDDESDQ